MNVLIDRHQADLYFAMQRLWEDRLGRRVYTPVGPEWWSEEVWQFGVVFGDDRLARQYLHLSDRWREIEPGIWLTFDPCHPERPLFGVTYERACAMEWEAVVATVQENQPGFDRFAHGRGARSFYQVGNTRQQPATLGQIVLNSTLDVGGGIHIGQEFDKDTTFRYRPPVRMDAVASFVNLLPLIPDPWAAFNDLRVRLPGWRFRSFGHSCPDGILQPVANIAEEMARTGWAFMDKVTGDGFGHIIHNWAAIGRPLIGHARYYRGQRAEVFWQDGITCIDLDRHSPDEAAEIMRSMTDRQHEDMCRAVRSVLDWSTDWEADAVRVRAVL